MSEIKKGFTLIELLVVIANIAILAAILFPVFAQAREKARSSSCLSNVKQMGTALQLYVDDYDETLPMPYLYFIDHAAAVNDATYKNYPVGQFTGILDDLYLGDMRFYTWMDALFPYVKNINMYKCPSVKNKAGYGYNAQFGNAWGSKAAWPTNPPGTALATINNTSKKVLLADTINMGGWTSFYVDPLYMWVTQSNCQANIGRAPDIVARRHNDGSNYCFCDGHAKFFKGNSGPSENGNANHYGTDNKYWDPAI
ncbi:MAG: DUF1559 domain-containing protein [Armatimonadetes bacterium]|nr:DUF1559 domain-containing protein [Candidatus Hippobium faecium]